MNWWARLRNLDRLAALEDSVRTLIQDKLDLKLELVDRRAEVDQEHEGRHRDREQLDRELHGLHQRDPAHAAGQRRRTATDNVAIAETTAAARGPKSASTKLPSDGQTLMPAA